MWRHSKLIGFICVVAALLAGLCLPAYWDATEIARRDRQIADDIDAELVKFFSSLGPEHEITRRYGNYVAILGTDHARHRGYIQAPAVVLPRRIDFEKGSVTAYIRVQSRAPTQLRARLMPSEESLADKPGYSIEQRTRPTATAPHMEKLFADNPWYRIEHEAVELWIVSPQSKVLSTIELNASHPQYVADRSELRHLRRVQDQTDQPIADLVDSVRSGEVDRAKSVQVWLEDLDSSASVEAFITRAMNESDPAVRLQAAKALTQLGDNGTWHLAPETLELVFSHLFDPAQDPAVRDELLRAALQSDQDSVSDLMERLKSAADGGRFAVPTVTAWLGDRSRRRWTVGYASSGPVRTMEFLKQLGPDAAHATNVLTMIAQEHPNQWNFRVAAVNALGAIGPDARESLPTLNLLTSSNDGKLVQASRAAIARIDSNAILPENYEIQFDSEKTQAAFYPIYQGEAFYWLSPDRQSILMTSGTAGMVYRIDRATRRATAFFEIETEGLVSVHATGDNVSVLRFERRVEGFMGMIDTWSMTSQQRISQKQILEFQPVDLPKKMYLVFPRWSPDGSMLALTRQIETPVEGRPGAVWFNESLHIIDIATGTPKVALSDREYDLGPIGFASYSQTLYAYGHKQPNLKDAVFAIDLKTSQCRSIANSDFGRDAIDSIVSDIPLVMKSLGSREIRCLDLSFETDHVIRLEHEVAHRHHNWQIETVFLPQSNQIVFFNHYGVEWFDAESFQRVRTETVFSPEGHFMISTISVLRDGDTVILFATSKPAGLGRTALWMREFE